MILLSYPIFLLWLILRLGCGRAIFHVFTSHKAFFFQVENKGSHFLHRGTISTVHPFYFLFCFSINVIIKMSWHTRSCVPLLSRRFWDDVRASFEVVESLFDDPSTAIAPHSQVLVQWICCRRLILPLLLAPLFLCSPVASKVSSWNHVRILTN